MRLASLSIDLDALGHYFRIHGLAEPAADRDAPDPVYTMGAARFGELASRLGVRGTVFCVGEALDRPGARAAVRALAEGGHEIANHSWSHDYRLWRRGRAEAAEEIRRGGEAVAEAAGRPARGFRAPGYALSPAILAALVDQGYRYDSSAFPAAPYWLAKAGVLAALRLAGRDSAAVLDRPRALLAPRVPYRPRRDEPYARGDLPIWELPVLTGLASFPLVGTFAAALPGPALRLLAAGARRRPLLVLELHGLDLLDASDAPAPLAAVRPDLRAPAARKMDRLLAFARTLERHWATLEEAAAHLGAC
ncbi:MAG TPA: polysaccharide deacetylase family protein [Anaeromyxobacteraceae bacterium]|nr:polysaccharide deacetylase family protein [Anaeromyxobacteraceae bacterium]